MSHVYDVLIRRKPTGVDGPEYEVLTVAADDAAHIATNATMAIALRNLSVSAGFWERVGIAACGTYDDWMNQRGQHDEYWGDY